MVLGIPVDIVAWAKIVRNQAEHKLLENLGMAKILSGTSMCQQCQVKLLNVVVHAHFEFGGAVVQILQNRWFDPDEEIPTFVLSEWGPIKAHNETF